MTTNPITWTIDTRSHIAFSQPSSWVPRRIIIADAPTATAALEAEFGDLPGCRSFVMSAPEPDGSHTFVVTAGALAGLGGRIIPETPQPPIGAPT